MIYLAPLEGLTTLVFRNAINSIYGGIDKYYTPFLTVTHLKGKHLREVDPENNKGMKVVPQILGNRPGEFIKLAQELKRLGYDLVHYDNQLNTPKEMKKRYKMETEKFSYFISPSKYASGVFRSGWNMKELGKENIIIEKGYPRNDFLFKYTEKDVSEIKQRILGEDIKNKKIILYAPTYRANQHESGVGYVYKEEVDFSKMREKLGDEFIILFRPHYFVANAFDFEKYKGFVYDVSKVDDINDLYVISDILITDYSSVFFDYANLKRPIIFYMYDLEYYRDKSNGFYFDVEKELPGKIIRTDDDLINEIIRISKEFTYDEKYKKFNEKFNYLDDGEASKRVVEEIIK